MPVDRGISGKSERVQGFLTHVALDVVNTVGLFRHIVDEAHEYIYRIPYILL